jgi:hypothetical protein
MRHIVAAAAATAVLVGGSLAARAQSFPTAAWSPLGCQRGVMVDAYRDATNFFDDLDLVGTAAAPAGFRAVDPQFLYLRMRVDVSPVQGQALRPSAWGFEINRDANLPAYQVLISLDGASQTVRLYRNSTTTVPDSPADPADAPPVATYPFAQNGRVVDAGPSLFGGGNDAFIDMAVPWSDLANVNLTPTSVATIWAGSSDAPDRLDGDIACNDAGGTTNLPRLSGNPPAPVALDPARAPGAPDGGGGNLIGGSGIEGGPGCAIAGAGVGGGRGRGGRGATALAVAVVCAGALSRRRRRRAR